ncbi:hypothetical protein SZN_31489 [Streptomyces zinciresistens K42]|uniref:Uncharacterized protein n=1 Tax=Streptomyces zinciresistens K42 TaxID=700597 RepID=G2GLA2_9ACTN|nr:hypothetical protein [Streptomyces zinciresistens]EGX55716.1 hypothetical protein SZN_31489 [Streptomyces zinciresistens K42]
MTRFLKAEGLDEAADEIRRAFGLAPHEGPEGSPSDEGDTTGRRPPRSSTHEGRPFTHAAAHPDADGGTHTFTPWTAESSTNNGSRDQWATDEDELTSPHLWDPSHRPRRPAAPRTRDEDGN